MLAKCAEIDAWLLGSGVTGRTVCYLSAEFVVRVIASSTEIEWRNNDNRDIYSYVVLSDKKLYRIKVGELPNTGGNDRIVNIPIVQIHRAIASSEALQGVSKKGLSQLRNLTIWNTVVNGIVLPAVGASSVTVLPLSSNTVFENNGDLIRVLEQENKGYYYMEINGELYPIDDTQYSLMYPGREDIVDEVDLGNLKYLRLIKVSPLKAMVIDGVINNFEVRLFKTDSPISEAQLATIIPKFNETNSRTLQVTNILGIDYDEFWSRVQAVSDSVFNRKYYDLTNEDKLILYDIVTSHLDYALNRMVSKGINKNQAKDLINNYLVKNWVEFMGTRDIPNIIALTKQSKQFYDSSDIHSYSKYLAMVLVEKTKDVGLDLSYQSNFPYIQNLGNMINGIPMSDVYDYATVSDWVYGTRNTSLPVGYQNITSEFILRGDTVQQSPDGKGVFYSDTATGYQAAILKKPNGDLVMVSRGTEQGLAQIPVGYTDLKDLLTDMLILAFVNVNLQFESSKKLYSRVRNNVNYENSKIVHTGHSLGGANANILAIWANEKDGKSDKSVTFDAPGVKNIIKDHLIVLGFEGLTGEEHFDYITNIDVAGDMVGGAFNHVNAPRFLVRPKVNDCHSIKNFIK